MSYTLRDRTSHSNTNRNANYSRIRLELFVCVEGRKKRRNALQRPGVIIIIICVCIFDSHLMSLLIELAFSLAASVNDCTRCRIESLVLAGLVGALIVRLPGCCCWNSSRMSAASDAGVAACERDGLAAYCRCWARCCDCEDAAAVVAADEGGRSEGAIDGSASSASAERSPEENLNERADDYRQNNSPRRFSTGGDGVGTREDDTHTSDGLQKKIERNEPRDCAEIVNNNIYFRIFHY